VNKKISPTLIGAFVVGAFALLVIAVIAFGSGQLFRKTREFVLYFDGTVNGLHIGAPVKFKGVEIGSVKNIVLQLSKDMEVNKIPVIIEIDLKKIASRGASADIAEQREVFERAIVDRGLRGQLQTESLLTGVLYIAIDFFPGTPINLVQQPDGDNQYPEIPTIPTEFEQAKDAITRIVDKLGETDFKGLAKSLTETVNGVNRTLNSPEIHSVLRSLAQVMPKVDEAVVKIRNLAGTTEDNVKTLSADLEHTSGDARLALKQAGDALKQTEETMKRAEAAVTNIGTLTEPDSRVNYELEKSLREVSAAARSLRLLADFIERDPRALIFGKPENQEGK
jgi:paraquat-inducible protein B